MARGTQWFRFSGRLAGCLFSLFGWHAFFSDFDPSLLAITPNALLADYYLFDFYQNRFQHTDSERRYSFACHARNGQERREGWRLEGREIPHGRIDA
jgi:hypothetical protein